MLRAGEELADGGPELAMLRGEGQDRGPLGDMVGELFWLPYDRF